MFDKKRFKEIIAEKDAMSWADLEDYDRMSKLWRDDGTIPSPFLVLGSL